MRSTNIIGVRVERAVTPEVFGAYVGEVPPDYLDRVAMIGEGMVNLTFVVTDNTEGGRGKFILQRLSSMFTDGAVRDSEIISRHLAREGLDVPAIIPTVDGAPYLRDSSGDLWRATTFIESDGAEAMSGEAYRAMGTLLGGLHGALSRLDYEPEFTIPHFHDVPYHAAKLEEHLQSSGMPGWARELGKEVLREYGNLSPLPDWGMQLVHGDPRPANMLFRDGIPFAIIDYDTFMRAPVWDDVGDLLRSIAEHSIEKGGREVSGAELRQVVNGYMEASHLDMNPDEFFKQALTAGKRITLDLAMRFLSDTVEAYFAPDATKYRSRDEFDKERALLQKSVYKNLKRWNREC